jgi:phosphoribosylformylglycinamidine synthase subunit PurL
VVAVAPGAEAEFAGLCADGGVPAATIGSTGGAALEVAGSFVIPLAELGVTHRGSLPRLFGP